VNANSRTANDTATMRQKQTKRKIIAENHSWFIECGVKERMRGHSVRGEITIVGF
jgi:hypothetical protein